MKYRLFLMFIFIASTLLATERNIDFKDSDLIINKKYSETKSLDNCVLKKHINFGSGYATGQAPNDIIVTYFDPADCSTPGYPFQVQSLSFTLIPLVNNNWPVKMDVVIFSSTVSGDKCSAPDAELYRFSVECDSASWTIPTIGTAFFPDTFCIDEPFYIGVQYADSFAHAPTYPSLLFDTTSFPDSCDNFYYFDFSPAEWHEWYDFWGSNIPGYPWFQVEGATLSSACSLDSDNDGIADSIDNCPQTFNPLQTDSDLDSVGDSCDNCPNTSNPSQSDIDNDGIGDACDSCPNDYLNDIDNDSVCESVDNCPGIYNPLQTDTDSDGRGDACENCCVLIRGNINNDPSETIDISDLVFLVDFMFGSPIGQTPPCFEEADVDGSTGIDITDLVYLVAYMFGSPSGSAPLNCP